MADTTAAGIAVRAADTGRVLMLQRSITDESDPARGKWEFPGGCLDQGETPLQGAVREWQEETGVPLPAGELAGSWQTGPYTGHVYVVPSEADVALNSDAEDRLICNPDDPDSDDSEVLAWWAPSDAQAMPALRDEARSTDWQQIAEAVPDPVFKATVKKRRYPDLVRGTVRKAGYPTLVRAHVRGSQIDPAALTELRTWFNAHPDIRACEAADYGFDPLQDPAKYLAAELAEPEHADLRSKPVDVAAIRQWERQEADYHDTHDDVAKEQPGAAAVHVDTPSGDISVGNLQGRRKKKPDEVIDEEDLDVKVLKADKAKQLVYGIVLEPHRVDSQGDWETPDDIEKACHRYLGQAFTDGVTDLVNLQHRWEAPAGVYPVENYIAPVDFTLNGEQVKKGSWVLVVKTADPEVWQQVIDGHWGGLSVEGTGRRRHDAPAPPLAKEDDGDRTLINRALELLAKGLGRDTAPVHVHFNEGAFQGPHVETHNHLPEQTPAPAPVVNVKNEHHHEITVPEPTIHLHHDRPSAVRVETGADGTKRYVAED